MKYQQLSIEEREFLKEGLWAKKSLRQIALEMKRSVATISREIKRNGRSGYYSPYKANERACVQKSSRGREARLKNDEIRAYVVSKLKQGWSPEQISGRLKLEKGQAISHEAIYQYIYHQVHRDGWGYLKPGKEDLRVYLKRRHKRRTKKGLRSSKRVGKIAGKSIDDRPAEVELRKDIAHWEGDSIVSKKSKFRLNTLVERKSGIVYITKMTDGTSEATRQAVIERLRPLPSQYRKTLTVDNGSENACLAALEEALGIDCYLAHAYHSWEKGTNENTNGLVRWYVPKGTDFAHITNEEIQAIENALNNRPRKRLGWRTPLEVFNQSVALES